MSVSLPYLATLLLAISARIVIGSHYGPLPHPSHIKECPIIRVECFESPLPEGEPLKFKATVSGGEQGEKLEYEWRVSRGKIKSGQGTPSITVDVKRDGTGVGASVRVKGLPEGCDDQEAGCAITHY